ncbi:hypothetical protein CI610_03010 [invertebrate metagenome]|uniref:Uncharacterized protein n=1 Tax=invertebrate metagenome TaxID=1711999 RepID=A0A2H9T4C6_9ZZZZ
MFHKPINMLTIHMSVSIQEIIKMVHDTYVSLYDIYVHLISKIIKMLQDICTSCYIMNIVKMLHISVCMCVFKSNKIARLVTARYR